MSNPDFVVTTVTPKQAEQYINGSNGTRNRPVKQSVCARYARDMRAKRWALNGEPLIIGKSGRVIDGRHRLNACVNAGVPFPTVIVTNVDDDAFDTIDGGIARSAGDVLGFLDIADPQMVAAVARYVWRHNQGNAIGTGGVSPSIREVEETIYAHPEILNSVVVGRRVGRIIPRGLAGYLHWLFSGIDSTLADTFMDALATGEYLSADEPLHKLRERLILDRAGKTRLVRREMAALVIKAWNLVRTRRKVKTLKWSNREEFPVAL